MKPGAVSRTLVLSGALFLVASATFAVLAVSGVFTPNATDTYGVSPAYANAATISSRSMDAQQGSRAQILSAEVQTPVVELAAQTSRSCLTLQCPPGFQPPPTLERTACGDEIGAGAPAILGNRIRPVGAFRVRITTGGPLCTTERGSQCVTADGTECETHLSNPLCNTQRGSQCITWQGTDCETHLNNPLCNSAQGSQCETYEGVGCNTHFNNPLCNSMRGSECFTYEGRRCRTHANNPFCNSIRGSQCVTYEGASCRTHRNNPLCNTARGSQCITYDGRACRTHRNNPDCNTVQQDDCVTFEGQRCRTNRNNPDCGSKTFINDPDCNTQASRGGGECVTSRSTDPACMTHVNNCRPDLLDPEGPGLLDRFFENDVVELHGAPERDLRLARPLKALAWLLLIGIFPAAATLRRRDG